MAIGSSRLIALTGAPALKCTILSSTRYLFPSYYGGNLNALNDCMCEDLEVPEVGGLVLVLRHYDRYSNGTHAAHNSGRSEAEIVLDIFARASRYQMLKGRRLITLAQSGDPLIHFDNLDGVSATWNSREWLNENRNL